MFTVYAVTIYKLYIPIIIPTIELYQRWRTYGTRVTDSAMAKFQ